MVLRKRRRDYGNEVNIAPLIDVVFLLIIFFMTVSQVTRVEVESLDLPEAKTGEEVKDALAGRLVISVHKDGQITVSERTHTLQSLQSLLTAEVKRRGSANIRVLIRGDRKSSWGVIGAIMSACAKRGNSRVRVAVVEPGSDGPRK